MLYEGNGNREFPLWAFEILPHGTAKRSKAYLLALKLEETGKSVGYTILLKIFTP